MSESSRARGEERRSWARRRREECYDGPVWVPVRRLRNWFVYVGAYVVRPVIKLAFRYKVSGLENLEGEEGPFVFACNHVSFADPIVLWCVLYRHFGGSRFLARSSLFRPVIGGLIARAGAIPIDPDSADLTAVKRAAAALKRGENLLIFPEGTRMNRPDKAYHPHAGVVLIARMGKAKVVPVGIAGTEKIMPYGKPRFLRFPRVRCALGKPFDVRDARFKAIPKAERAERLAAEIMDRCFQLRDSVAHGGGGEER